MGYQLGIDLGTTYTAAATCRLGRPEVVSLGSRTASVPSVVLLQPDETVLVGEAASRRAATQPDRVSREFKRRLGDTTPLFLGGVPYSVEALMAKLFAWVATEVRNREGSHPERVTISHPANWGTYKIDLLRHAATLADLSEVELLSEPHAAAAYYASQERVEIGSTVAVYDLGGGTFDAAVLRKTEDGFEQLGRAEGIERLGGVDFDAAVFAHVQRVLRGSMGQLDTTDPKVLTALARLRTDCCEAKEALSLDADAAIPVFLPNSETEVRITRPEFESMIRPAVSDSVDVLRRTIRSAQLDTDDVSVVLLVGGSSRIPLVAQLVSAGIGRPIALDAHPKHAVALGAALVANRRTPRAAVSAASPLVPAPATQSVGTATERGIAPTSDSTGDATDEPVSVPAPIGEPVTVEHTVPSTSSGAPEPVGEPQDNAELRAESESDTDHETQTETGDETQTETGDEVKPPRRRRKIAVGVAVGAVAMAALALGLANDAPPAADSSAASTSDSPDDSSGTTSSSTRTEEAEEGEVTASLAQEGSLAGEALTGSTTTTAGSAATTPVTTRLTVEPTVAPQPTNPPLESGAAPEVPVGDPGPLYTDPGGAFSVRFPGNQLPRQLDADGSNPIGADHNGLMFVVDSQGWPDCVGDVAHGANTHAAFGDQESPITISGRYAVRYNYFNSWGGAGAEYTNRPGVGADVCIGDRVYSIRQIGSQDSSPLDQMLATFTILGS